MPERNFRRSPARAAAAAAAVAVAQSAVATQRSRSPARRSEKSPARRTEKSPARRPEKSPARRSEKSPARRSEKSPARRPEKSPNVSEKSSSRAARKPSPGRKTASRRKSPARKPKSPARSFSAAEVTSTQKEEIIHYPRVLSNHDRGDGFDFDFQPRTRGSRESSVASSVVLIRRITANKMFQEKLEETKEIEHLKVTEERELEYPEKQPPSKSENEDIIEFGGRFGILVLQFFSQASLLLTHIYCSKANYGIKDFKIPLDWRAYFDIEVAALFLGYVLLQFVLSILPVGKVVDGLPDKLGRLQYRCNGFLNTFITLAIFALLKYFEFPVTMIVDKYVQFFVTGLIFAYVLAVLLYVRGGRTHFMAQNAYAVTGSHIYDFWMGREVNPQIGPFDIKSSLVRTGVIGLILVNVAIIAKSLEQSSGYSPTLLLAAGLQIWYCLDHMWFEECFLASFEVRYEGTGYMLTLGYNMFPYIPTIITRFLLNYRLEIPLYALAAIVVIHTIGYVIYRGSNLQKNEFRKNPLNPALAHLETIPTQRGRKILVSGWWGWVRHPNYLGDIIMHWTWASCCGIAHPLPYIVPLFVTLLLLHRAKRDDARCKQRYNAAWERYSNRVQYHVIPRVF
ncbi:delta(14)-sterol reductase TM7SF2 isoform X2 [Periplaneta americana]|uniref:delta(14)-sterol reductase TM7SF2 isoform X2 n=1 Tax=Periplaneta americana TaxID=6978 RepID=UPI0037E99611